MRRLRIIPERTLLRRTRPWQGVLAIVMGASCADSGTDSLAPSRSAPVVAPAPPNYDPYLASELPLPVGYWWGSARAINTAGVVVGVVGNNTDHRAVKWVNGQPVLLGGPAFGSLVASEATDVDDTGRSVGYVKYNLFSTASHAAVWGAANGSAATVMTGSQPFTDWSVAKAISPSGLAVGESFTVSAGGSSSPPRPLVFTVSTGVATLLPLPSGYTAASATDISATNTIAGVASGPGPQRAIVWQRGILTQAFIPRLLDPSMLRAVSVGDDGAVYAIRSPGASPTFDAVRIAPNGSVQAMWSTSGCGTYSESSFSISSPSIKGRVVGCGTPPRTWYNGSVAQLPLPSGSIAADPFGVNACGTIVGGATVNGQLRPIIWRKTKCD